MGIFPSLMSTRSHPSRVDHPWINLFGARTNAGVSVAEKDALKYLTVAACVTLVGGDISKLPFNIMQKNKDGSRGRVTQHPLDDLLHTAPNPETASFSWREAKQGPHLMLWGNTYDLTIRDKAGRVRQLWQFPEPGLMRVERLKKDSILIGPDGERRQFRTGELIYTYLMGGVKATFRRSEIFHIPGFGFNGLTGISMIGLAREAIGLGLAAEALGSKYFSKGAHLSGLVTLPEEAAGSMDAEEQKRYIARLHAQYAGLGNSHAMMVLVNGEKYSPLSMPLNDAQFLETREFQKTEICGFYHVPPHKIGVHGSNSNYNNLEQENQGYVDSCLSHWVTRWEQCVNLQLLTEDERKSRLYSKMNLKGLLMGDSEARANLYDSLANKGLPLNRILELEDMNPVEGGDEGYIQINMIPLKNAKKIDVKDNSGGNARDIRTSGNRNLPGASVVPAVGHERTVAQTQSIQARDRIVSRYYPLIEKIAQQIVGMEAEAVRSQISKYRSHRDEIDDIIDWLDDFYGDLPAKIKADIGPVFRAFADSIREAVAAEIQVDPSEIDIDQFVSDYIDRYAEKHTDRSHKQLLKLLRGDLEDLETRVGEWQERRAEKIANEETVRASNAVYNQVVFAFGYSVYWRTRGKSCDYCKALEGLKIGRGESFFNGGEEWEPEGAQDGAIKIRGKITHAPLHPGCDCYTSIF